MNKNIIYGLYCPILDRLHYIGKSSSYMTRPTQHLSDSHSEKINEWVSQLKLLGYKPIIKILEECEEENLEATEIKWIKQSSDDGAYLLNVVHNKTEKIVNQKEYEFDNSDMIKVGEKVRSKRKEMKLTQDEISKMSKIDRTTLVMIEKGNGRITLNNLNKVLNVLGLKIEVM